MLCYLLAQNQEVRLQYNFWQLVCIDHLKHQFLRCLLFVTGMCACIMRYKLSINKLFLVAHKTFFWSTFALPKHQFPEMRCRPFLVDSEGVRNSFTIPRLHYIQMHQKSASVIHDRSLTYFFIFQVLQMVLSQQHFSKDRNSGECEGLPSLVKMKVKQIFKTNFISLHSLHRGLYTWFSEFKLFHPVWEVGFVKLCKIVWWHQWQSHLAEISFHQAKF